MHTKSTPGFVEIQDEVTDGFWQTTPTSALSESAWELDQQYHFSSTGNLWLDWGGLQEKWFWGSGTWFYIVPSGGVYRSFDGQLTETIFASLSPEYHADPELLLNPVRPGGHRLVVEEGTTYADRGFGEVELETEISGQVFEDLNSDGVWDTIEQPQNGWTVGLIDAEGNVVATTTTGDLDVDENGTIDGAAEQGWYVFDRPDRGNYSVRVTPESGWDHVDDPLLNTARQLDQDLEIRLSGNFYINWGGLEEKWLQSNRGWLFITLDGSLFEAPNSDMTDTMFIEHLSPDYHANPDLLFAPPNDGERKAIVPLITSQPKVDFPIREEQTLNGSLSLDDLFANWSVLDV